jgi:hypothetical protein
MPASAAEALSKPRGHPAVASESHDSAQASCGKHGHGCDHDEEYVLRAMVWMHVPDLPVVTLIVPGKQQEKRQTCQQTVNEKYRQTSASARLEPSAPAKHQQGKDHKGWVRLTGARGWNRQGDGEPSRNPPKR